MSAEIDARDGADAPDVDGAGDGPVDGSEDGVATYDSPFGPGEDATDVERAVWAALDEVEDPHLPLSLVEMAMIYDVRVEEGEVAGGGDAATVEISFPCMGCPAYGFIHDDVETACHDAGVEEVEIDVVWDPVWSKDMMPAHAKETLRNSGIGI